MLGNRNVGIRLHDYRQRRDPAKKSRTRNPAVDPARVEILVRRERRQGLRLTRNRMTRNLLPSQLRYQLPQFASVGLMRVRAACSTGNRRTAADSRSTSKRLLIHEPFPALPSSQPGRSLFERLGHDARTDTTGSFHRRPVWKVG